MVIKSGERRCYVCNTAVIKEEKIALHSFPKRENEAIFKKWLLCLNLNEKDEVKNLRICSRHFLVNDFKTSFGGRLKNDAVPSVLIPGSRLAESQDDSSAKCSLTEVVHVECDVSICVEDAQVTVGSLDTEESPSKSSNGGSLDQRMTPEKRQDSNGDDNQTHVKGSDGPRRFCRSRYISEVTKSDVVTPRRRARTTIPFIKTSNSIKSARVKRLQAANRRLTTKTLALQHEVACLRKRVEGNVSERDLTDKKRYSLASLQRDLLCGQLPDHWAISIADEKIILYYFGNNRNESDQAPVTTRSVSVRADMSVEIRGRGKLYNNSLLPTAEITSKEDIIATMKAVASLPLCAGIDDGSCHGEGFLPTNTHKQRPACAEKLKGNSEKSRLAETRLNLKMDLLRKQKATLQKRVRRLSNKLKKTVEIVKDLQYRCENTERLALEKAIRTIPAAQQEAMMACLDAANAKVKTRQRYSYKWIMECLLLLMKSREAYNHIRNRNILVLPSIKTLHAYLKKLQLQPSYESSSALFRTMVEKALHMEPNEKRGTVIVKEMKVSEAIAFDSINMLFKDITDLLGDHKPEGKENVRGDHAL